MGLETPGTVAWFIADDMDDSNPVSGDKRGIGDDHFRLVKQAMKSGVSNPGELPASAVTDIASAVLTVTRFFMIAGAQTDTSPVDTLATITDAGAKATDMRDGKLLLVKADAGDTITVVNTGNINLTENTDCVLVGDDDDAILLIRKGATWYEISRSNSPELLPAQIPATTIALVDTTAPSPPPSTGSVIYSVAVDVGNGMKQIDDGGFIKQIDGGVNVEDAAQTPGTNGAHYLVVAASAGRAVTLPSANIAQGARYHITNTGTGGFDVTINTTTSGTGYVLSDGEWVEFIAIANTPNLQTEWRKIGGTPKKSVITATGTDFVPPIGVYRIFVELVGGGGGGGGSDNTPRTGAGGGAGGYVEGFRLAAPGTTYDIIIGAGGGFGAIGGAGTLGGDTTFDSVPVDTAWVGSGGVGGSAPTAPTGGLGGAVTGGDVGIPGGDGGAGGDERSGSSGGASRYGGGGAGGIGTTTTAGNTARAYGAGGGGGGSDGATGAAGGSGFAGICIVTY